MASNVMSESSWVETRFREDDHPEWKATFAAPVRKLLVDDDLEAGRTISAVLIAIVCLGTILTALAVALILKY